jgi:hypothetical protein
MQDSTLKILVATLKADASVAPIERTRLLLILRSHGKQIQSLRINNGVPKIICRKQAAERLNVSLRSIDLLARQGVLKKCTLPGRQRAVGIFESSLLDIVTAPEAN